MTDLLVPLLLLFVSLYGLFRRQDVYACLLQGAREGLSTLLSIVPSLIILLTAISMLRASGFFDLSARFLSPLFRALGMPPELAPLMLVRPVSGGAALAVGAELMKTYGVDSLIGKTAAVMLGSTETTFYTISVYFGASGIRDTRHTVFAALLADCTGFSWPASQQGSFCPELPLSDCTFSVGFGILI